MVQGYAFIKHPSDLIRGPLVVLATPPKLCIPLGCILCKHSGYLTSALTERRLCLTGSAAGGESRER